jgi:predicted transcriptional regulator
MARSRGRGELGDAVLAALQAAPGSRTAGEVRDDLGGDLAYTTVLTILVRLHAKGVLDREKRGRAYAYRPVSDEAGLAALRMRQVLDERADRDAVLARFVGDLTDDDEQALRRLLGD